MTIKQIAKGKGERAEQAREIIRLNEEADNHGKEMPNFSDDSCFAPGADESEL